ncbi:MAG: hypothetical protein VX590_00935 [Chloroflexota bacterium]|nr:hypothetical protein [Chloroflexota bacterium]
MKKILFIILIGLIFGCARETAPPPEVDIDATVEAWVGIELEEKKPEPTATPVPEPTATPKYSLNLEFTTKKLPLYSFIYLNDFGLEILNSGGLEDGPVKAKWSFYNKEDLLVWEKDFDLAYIDGKTEKTLDGEIVNSWLSADENSWPSVQVIIVAERLLAKSFISINGGENIPFFNISVTGNTY